MELPLGSASRIPGLARRSCFHFSAVCYINHLIKIKYRQTILMRSSGRIVIVGAGQAGGRGAEALRAHGFGGEILLIGNEAFRPYERPPLSKELLLGTASDEKPFLQPSTYYEDRKIALRTGAHVTEIDRANQRLRIEGGSTEPYDLLLLATGNRAKPLNSAASALPPLMYLRDMRDAFRLRETLSRRSRIAILGAGFIGLEVAAAALAKGNHVTVFEMADQPLARVVAPEIGAYVADLHQSRGVSIHTGARIQLIEERKSEIVLQTEEGKQYCADVVVVGIGAVPNIELARACGLQTDNGIVVDEFGRTSDPHIFAAGDVTCHYNPILDRRIRLEAWQNAQNQSIAVAKIMAGGSEPFAEVPWFWSDQYEMNLQIAGVPASWDMAVRREGPRAGAFTVFYLGNGRVVGAIAVNNGRDMKAAKGLIAKRQAVDPEVLRNPSTKLLDLLRAAQ